MNNWLVLEHVLLLKGTIGIYFKKLFVFKGTHFLFLLSLTEQPVSRRKNHCSFQEHFFKGTMIFTFVLQLIISNYLNTGKCMQDSISQYYLDFPPKV